MFIFISKTDSDYSVHTTGSVIWETADDEMDILENLQDIGALMEYIASQFPQGWRILDGKVVSEPIKCFLCEKAEPAKDMTEFTLSGGPEVVHMHLCPGCKDIHWKEYL